MKKQLTNFKKQIKKRKQIFIKYRNLNFNTDKYADPKGLDEFYYDIYQQFYKQYTKGKFSFASIKEIKRLALKGRCFFIKVSSKNLRKLIKEIGYARFFSTKSQNINGRLQILENFQYMVGRRYKLNQYVSVVRVRNKVEKYPFKDILLIHFYKGNEDHYDLKNYANKMKDEEAQTDIEPYKYTKQENQQDQQPNDNLDMVNSQAQRIPSKQTDDLFERLYYQKVKVELDDNKQGSADKEQERKIIDELKKEIAQLKKESEIHTNEKYQYIKHIQDLEIQIRQLLNENSDLGNKLRTIEINILKEMQRFSQKEAAMKKEQELKKQIILVDDS